MSWAYVDNDITPNCSIIQLIYCVFLFTIINLEYLLAHKGFQISKM